MTTRRMTLSVSGTKQISIALVISLMDFKKTFHCQARPRAGIYARAFECDHVRAHRMRPGIKQVRSLRRPDCVSSSRGCKKNNRRADLRKEDNRISRFKYENTQHGPCWYL